MSQLSVMLQERARREREARTVLEILREQMDDADGGRGGERRSLKQRLRLNGIGCCGATWAFRRTAAISLNEEDEDPPRQQHPLPLPPPQQQEVINVGQALPGNDWDPGCVGPISTGSGMNLAAALAAERQFRAPQDPDVGGPVGPTSVPGTPLRVSLMRLLEETETDGGDASGAGAGAGAVAVAESEKVEGAMGNDSVCCVCMGRKKGAAFIPCGHTFCRVCSREVWLNRGSCPLCNRSILEILDIF